MRVPNKFFLFCLLVLSAAGCKSEGTKSTTPGNEPLVKAVSDAVSADKANKAAETQKKSELEITATQKKPIAPVLSEAERQAKIQSCINALSALPGKSNSKELRAACEETAQLPRCISEEGVPIFHYDRVSDNDDSQRILTFALIHGDEMPSGSVARAWMERLSTINPRNSWRVVPILNPDGLKRKTRTNANKVDVNRNFPTDDWDRLAHKWWKKKSKGDKRKFPGDAAASEKETLCAMDHIEDFKPSLIISIHTPYGVLDFDGPRIETPKFSPLPWISLGNYPGSLGRYMWVGKKVPVLTIELKGNRSIKRLQDFDRLQDISGSVAIQVEKILAGPRSFSPDNPELETPEDEKKKADSRRLNSTDNKPQTSKPKKTAQAGFEYI